MTDSQLQGFAGIIRETLNEALLDLGPDPSQERIEATCKEVLSGCHLVPTVDMCWADPDGTFHSTIKWKLSK